MDFARSVVYSLCIIFGMAGGQLWHEHRDLVVVGGIVWFIFLLAFFFYAEWREEKADYSGRHRG